MDNQKLNERYLFRGMRKLKAEWVYGSLIFGENDWSFIVPIGTKIEDYEHVRIRVITETVGMWSGLTDKNGVKVFEGDKIKGGVRTMDIIFKRAACQFWMVWQDNEACTHRYEPLNATFGDSSDFYSNDSLEVIGNIYDKLKQS